MMGILIICAGVGLAFSTSAANDTGRLYAGTAKVDITPDEGKAVNMMGAKLKIRDHLFARVLVLKNDKTSLAIVSLDLILFSSKKVVDEAKEKWKVDHVILCSTHTHAGMAPKGLIIGGGKKDWTRGGDPAELIDWPALSEDPWYAATEEKIVAAIGDAMKNIFPANIAAGRGPFESVYMAHNRRLVSADGKQVTAMWDNPKRLPTKPIDPTVGVMQVNDDSGKPRAFLVNYACHAVASNGAGVLYRDFPGEMVDYVEKEMGPDCMAMFTQGAEGDQDPYDMASGEHGFNIIKQAGISLAKGALLVAKNIKPQQDKQGSSIKVKESMLKIKCRRSNKVSDVAITTVVINNDMAIVAIPGEPFIQHQLDLTAKSPLDSTFMLGLAYSGAGTPFAVYIPTAKAVKEGGYGAAECSFLEADAGAKIVDEGVASIKELMKGSGK
jgi:hypothetical protein